MSREDVCLGCTLPICDDKDKRCAFVQITRTRPQREANNAASRRYRANNRPKRLATERQWRARHGAAIYKRKRARRAVAKKDPVSYEAHLAERRRRYAERKNGDL